MDQPKISIADFQKLIREMYLEKDIARGIDGTFMWLMEEVGELASALRNGTHEERLGEFADVLAWLATIANVAGVDLTEAVARKYFQTIHGFQATHWCATRWFDHGYYELAARAWESLESHPHHSRRFTKSMRARKELARTRSEDPNAQAYILDTAWYD